MFRDIFQALPEATGMAFGRVNLLGEHTDYNEGYVLPTPVPYWTAVEVGAAQGLVEAYSEALKEFRARSLDTGPAGDFLDYLAGVIWALRRAGYRVDGARFYIKSTLPIGTGLSSSAALEVAALKALRQLYRLNFDDKTLALVAQKAEVEYVGVRCGIMDQMVAALGELGKALFLDTRTLEHALLPLPSGTTLQLLDPGIPRRLANARYNERRRECEQAARLLEVPALRDVVDLRLVESLPEPLLRRARHVVSENERVLLGITALRRGDGEAFGRLMYLSHRSLSQDFEVSLPELDALVDNARQAGALGAKLTGAGFGGTVVALIRSGEEARFRQALAQSYPGIRILGQD